MPESLSPALLTALASIAKADHLLIALDFDGTMSPLVPLAADARPLPGSASALSALGQLPETTTALVSGRALDSLRSVATPDPETLLIGSHGAETWTGPDGAPLTLTDQQTDLLRRATAAVQRVVDSHHGTMLESKPAGVVLHTRTADDDVAAAATDAARAALDQLEGAHITDGKRVLETSVISADKGQGIRSLRKYTGATAVLFAGDDVTDEHAFAALEAQDLGIKIGDGETRASHRIHSPEELVLVLERLLELRRTSAQS
ncbi:MULTISPECIES: trehalose-phosphatase [unclassified Arthrobacter]|uniref:trehalose-phosphatase n=1 Tax=unclassified Arthrobacter TaxID=235627 RepID=UPI001491E5BA|nr:MULTISPECIES: trehalose-phosphatase [unclassified Arthrobacter]MBE0010558.1 trehalose-phosphatase [Arthrobacter sp. AET 35A]NOJ64365.1 trehalose-phosphatase [Arthrobacter sp. 147(2020)]